MSDPTKGHRVILTAAADVLDDVPVWAWEYADKGRIQLGTLDLFAGRPGAGKSTAARWFAAGFSGRPAPMRRRASAASSERRVLRR